MSFDASAMNEDTCNKEYRRLLQHASNADLHGADVFESIHNRDDSYDLISFSRSRVVGTTHSSFDKMTKWESRGWWSKLTYHMKGLTQASTWKLRKCQISDLWGSRRIIPMRRRTKAARIKLFVINPMIVQNPNARHVKNFNVVYSLRASGLGLAWYRSRCDPRTFEWKGQHHGI